MHISVGHLDSFIMYVSLFLLAAPLLLWLLFRDTTPTVAANETAKLLVDRMVPIARQSLHNLGVDLRHGQEPRLAQDRRLGQDRRSLQVNALAI